MTFPKFHTVFGEVGRSPAHHPGELNQRLGDIHDVAVECRWLHPANFGTQ